jgi:hypothetical protein
MNRAERRSLKGAPSVVKQIVRPKCPLCSGALLWMGLGDAVDTLGVDQVNEFLDEMQGAITDDDVIEFWRCRKCGHVGALASLQVD